MYILKRNKFRTASSKNFLPAVMLLCWMITGFVAAPVMGASLFTEEEADLLRYNDAEWAQVREDESSATKSLMPDGPVIELLEPKAAMHENVVMATPASLHFRFVSTGEPVDMSSLRVIGRKFFIKKDLTDRLVPFIKGEEVVARDLDIPTGKFILDVEISDTKGAVSKQSYKVVVKS